MNSNLSLAARIAALDRELELAQVGLERIRAIEKDLYERVRVRFRDEVQKRRQALKKLQDSVVGRQQQPAQWAELAELRAESDALFNEALAFIHGALTRRGRFDEDLCRIADTMLDQLCGETQIVWNRVTVLADTTFYGDTAQIIRLRYAGASIWKLPLIAHEFGHFIGPEMRSDVHLGRYRLSVNPVGDRLKAELSRSELAAAELDECFADVFATYTMGPAYALTCVLLEFEPATACAAEDWYHPSAVDRVYLILATLERLKTAAHPFGQYLDVIDRIRLDWRRSLEAADQRPDLEPARAMELDQQLAWIWTTLESSLSAIRFRGLEGPRKLLAALSRKQQGSQTSEDIRDVLNAAWLGRYDGSAKERQAEEIAAWALASCRTIAGVGQRP